MGKGGGGSQPTQSTSYTTNLPEYAQPYVMNMLGAAQNQLFTTSPGTTDASGKTTPGEITGFRPYTPYSTDPTQYFAGPTGLQQGVYREAGQMQTPGQYAPATGLAGMAGMGQMRAGQQYARQATDPYAVQSYMSPYQQNVTDIAKMNAVREAQIAGQQANLGAARQGTYGGARQALAGAERERNLLSNLSNIQAQGSQAAYDKAVQNMQYGANLGLQGLSGATQSASTLGGLGTAQQQADLARMGFQQQTGAAQQQYQQGIINQAIQDYATAQQYPYMQLSTMSNLLRGLPMQSMSTQQYQAQAPLAQQALGLAGAYGAYKGAFKEGGTVEGYSVGGLPDADVSLEAKMKKMADTDPKGLAKLVAQSSSKEVKEIGRDLLSGIALGNTGKLGTNMAGGGIIAFEEGGDVPGFYSGGDPWAAQRAREEDPEVFLSKAWFKKNFEGSGGISNSKAALRAKDIAEQQRLNARENPEFGEPIARSGEDPYAAANPVVPNSAPGVNEPPAAPTAAAPSAAPAAASTGTRLPVRDAQGFLADRTAMYKELGIDPTANERSKKLMEYYDEQRAKQGEQSAEQSRFNKALAFLEAGQTTGGLGAAAIAGGRKFLTGEAEIQKGARAMERLNMEAAEKLESAQRKEAKGDIDGAMKDYADYRRDMVSLQVAEASANKQEQLIERAMKDPAFMEALRSTKGLDSKAQQQALINYTKWEGSAALTDPTLRKLAKAAKDGSPEAVKALADYKDQVYNQFLTRAGGAAPTNAGGKLDAKQQALLDKYNK